MGNGSTFGTDEFGNPTFGNPTYGPTPTSGYALGEPTSFAPSGGGAGKYIAGGAAVAGGAFAAYNGFSSGGAQGGLEGAGGTAGAASGIVALAGVTGPAGPILAGVGIGLGMIAALLGDPKQNRSNAISKEIRDALYMTPPSVSLQSDITGRQTRMNRAGQIEATPWDAFRYQVNSPYYNSLHETVPGTVVYLNMTVHAFDAKSVVDQRNVIATAVHQAMQEGHPINYQVQSVAGR